MPNGFRTRCRRAAPSAAGEEKAFGKRDRIGVRDAKGSMPRVEPATKGARTVAQQEYERNQAIDSTPEEVFAWLSDVGNLPRYPPPVVDSSLEDLSAEGVPGWRIKTTLEYPGEGGAPSMLRATCPRCPTQRYAPCAKDGDRERSPPARASGHFLAVAPARGGGVPAGNGGIRKTKAGGRAAYYCFVCQREER
jgi:hypothetical protein